VRAWRGVYVYITLRAQARPGGGGWRGRGCGGAERGSRACLASPSRGRRSEARRAAVPDAGQHGNIARYQGNIRASTPTNGNWGLSLVDRHCIASRSRRSGCARWAMPACAEMGLGGWRHSPALPWFAVCRRRETAEPASYAPHAAAKIVTLRSIAPARVLATLPPLRGGVGRQTSHAGVAHPCA
jgi:hypothetical protein